MKSYFLTLLVVPALIAFAGCQTTDDGGADSGSTPVYSQEPVSDAERATQLQQGFGSILNSTGGNIR